MFPQVHFLGLNLYWWCHLVGIAGALVFARVFADRLKIPPKLQNATFLVGFCAIAIGYFSAIFFQSLYDWAQTGTYTLGKSTGATFYGGLLGGAAAFFFGYFFIEGKLLRLPTAQFLSRVTGVAACAVAFAHGVGRIGCFMEGCCYGRTTDAWYGVYLPAVGAKVIPTQLIEAVFLLLLFVALTLLLFKTEVSCLGVYLAAYSLMRFFVEFLRGDNRGGLAGSPLSPSQVFALLLFSAGCALLALTALRLRRNRQNKP